MDPEEDGPPDAEEYRQISQSVGWAVDEFVQTFPPTSEVLLVSEASLLGQAIPPAEIREKLLSLRADQLIYAQARDAVLKKLFFHISLSLLNPKHDRTQTMAEFRESLHEERARVDDIILKYQPSNPPDDTPGGLTPEDTPPEPE
jgi:hypothetical protein